MMIVRVVNDPFSFHNHFTLITQHTDTAVAENRNSPQHSHFCQHEFMVSFLPFYLDMQDTGQNVLAAKTGIKLVEKLECSAVLSTVKGQLTH